MMVEQNSFDWQVQGNAHEAGRIFAMLFASGLAYVRVREA